MRRFIRYCLLSSFLLFAGSLTTNLHAQFYSVQSNTLKLATTTFNVEGSMLLDKHWTLNMSVSYNPWNFSDKKDKALSDRARSKVLVLATLCRQLYQHVCHGGALQRGVG